MRIKCDLFLFIDAQDPITDAVQLISKMINVETRCIQFTNMGMQVPLMITSADVFFLFQKNLKYFSLEKYRTEKLLPVRLYFSKTNQK